MTDTLTFEVLRDAWNRVKTEKQEEFHKLSPNLTDPTSIYIKRISEDENYLTVEFKGFNESSDEPSTAEPQTKRLIINWLQRISNQVQISRSSNISLIVRLAKDLKISEAAVSIMKRDPRTNKIKKYYRCIGGKKDGKKVADPSDCIGVPDFDKKLKFGISKRTNKARTTASKTKTRLTNIVSRKVRKANKRLSTARGF